MAFFFSFYIKYLTKHPVYINKHSLNTKQVSINVITQTIGKNSNISKDMDDHNYIIKKHFLDLRNMTKYL